MDTLKFHVASIIFRQSGHLHEKITGKDVKTRIIQTKETYFIISSFFFTLFHWSSKKEVIESWD